MVGGGIRSIKENDPTRSGDKHTAFTYFVGAFSFRLWYILAMSNIKARVDHLFDKFKHDLYEIIDIAVAEERDRILSDISEFVNVPSKAAVKTTDRVIIPPAPVLPSVRDIEKAEREKQKQEPKPCGFCKRRGEPCARHGGVSTVYVPKKKEAGSDPRQRYCINCRSEPINLIIYNSDKFCSKECSNRFSARKSIRKRKGLSLPSEEPVYEPITNRPLIEFVGKKKRTIDLPEVVIHKSTKSYSDHLREKGLSVRPTFDLSK